MRARSASDPGPYVEGTRREPLLHPRLDALRRALEIRSAIQRAFRLEDVGCDRDSIAIAVSFGNRIGRIAEEAAHLETAEEVAHLDGPSWQREALGTPEEFVFRRDFSSENCIPDFWAGEPPLGEAGGASSGSRAGLRPAQRPAHPPTPRDAEADCMLYRGIQRLWAMRQASPKVLQSMEW